MPTKKVKSAIPKWTQRVATDMGGRDPLGLSRTSGMITDYLVEGIITTTSRARYYSFYLWCLWHIDQTENPKRYSDFAAAFRRREAFMALSTTLVNGDSSVVGALTVRPRLQRSIETGEVDTNFAVLPSNALGGYGQYYGGSLYALGLVRRTEDGIDHVAPGRGEAIAECYNTSVIGTPYCAQECFRDKAVPLKVLKKSSDTFSLDYLSTGGTEFETKLLSDLFFSRDKDSTTERDLLRRQTLCLILNSIVAYENVGSKADLNNLDFDVVYPVYYYDVLWIDDSVPRPYEVPLPLLDAFTFWKLFCAHEFLTYALEMLLKATLDSIELKNSGIEIDTLCSILAGKQFESVLSESFGNASAPCVLLGSLGLKGPPDHKFCAEVQTEIGAASSRSEWSLIDHKQETPEESTALALSILGVLYAKWRGFRSKHLGYLGERAGFNLWTGVVLPTMDGWFEKDLGWRDALSPILTSFVLSQHDRTMYEKGRLESCWLHRQDGKIWKDQDYQPMFRNTRHNNCVHIMSDLGLLSIDDDGKIAATKEGRRLLKKALEGNGVGA